MELAEFPDLIKPLARILSPQIEFIDHSKGAEIMAQIFGCPTSDLPEGEGWAEDNLSICTHAGTHVDAPWHYGSRTGASKAKTIDEIPLEDLYCDAVVLDITAKKGSASAISIDDLKSALDKVQYQIKKGDAVLLRTDHDKFALTDPMRYMYPGMTRESSLWLAEQGAKIGGTDGTGWDRPFPVMVADYQRTKDKKQIWDAHYAFREVEFYIIQQMCNLHLLPPHGFKVAFFPINLVGASAAPARVVAFVD